MTVDEIMELVSDYASDVEDIASSEALFAHVGKSRYTQMAETLAAIRTATE